MVIFIAIFFKEFYFRVLLFSTISNLRSDKPSMRFRPMKLENLERVLIGALKSSIMVLCVLKRLFNYVFGISRILFGMP